jgi:hypothetical protein
MSHSTERTKSRPGRAFCERHRAGRLLRAPRCSTPSRGRVAGGAPLRRRGAQGSGPRAQRASMTDSPRLFERSERSERSEFGGGPRGRAPQGSHRAAVTAAAKQPPATRPRLGELGRRGDSATSTRRRIRASSSAAAPG